MVNAIEAVLSGEQLRRKILKWFWKVFGGVTKGISVPMSYWKTFRLIFYSRLFNTTLYFYYIMAPIIYHLLSISICVLFLPCVCVFFFLLWVIHDILYNSPFNELKDLHTNILFELFGEWTNEHCFTFFSPMAVSKECYHSLHSICSMVFLYKVLTNVLFSLSCMLEIQIY